MNIGYARVSTGEQNPDLQLDALNRAGCARIYTDKGRGGSGRSRPQLDKCLAELQPGDVLTVWKLDRLGRSLPHLVAVLEDLHGRGVGFVSLTEAIDTGTAAGRLLGHIIGALAEFERALIVERTRAGIKAAKGRGVKLGRRPALSSEQVRHARKLIEAGESAGYVARLLGVARSTLYKSLEKGND
jgi:DNA invertase Pin-like site-specific DNA recombinase